MSRENWKEFSRLQAKRIPGARMSNASAENVILPWWHDKPRMTHWDKKASDWANANGVDLYPQDDGYGTYHMGLRVADMEREVNGAVK